MTLHWFVMAYATVFAVEVVSDKSVIAVGALATRYRATPIFLGLVLAFMCKSLGAVLLGHSLTLLPAGLLAGASALAFFLSAIAIWRRRGRVEASVPELREEWAPGTTAAFSSVFFAEWADIGQVTTAALAARSDAPLSVWLGATLALSTKGLLAIVLGVGLSRAIPERTLRLAGATLCVFMGILAAVHIRVRS